MTRWIAVLGLCLTLVGCGGDKGPAAPDGEELPVDAEIQLAGKIKHDGRNITENTSTPVSFWFRDEDTGAPVDSATATYDAQTGTYSVTRLPKGTIGVSLSVHETGEMPTFPGNCRSWTIVDLPALPEGQATAYDLDIQRIMHLVAPSTTPPTPR